MKNIFATSSLLAAALLLSPIALADPAKQDNHAPAQQSNLSQEQVNVVKALQGYSAGINAKNVAQMEKYLAVEGTELTMFEGSGMNVGWADYRDHHLVPEFANPDLVFHKYEFENITPIVSGDWASATFSIDKALTYKGKDINQAGRGTAILKHVDGRWIITHLHTS